MAKIQEYIQVIVSGPKADLDKIARKLVEDKLVACVQVTGPIHSTYWWEGAIEEAEEWLCLIKTKKNMYPQVEEAIRKLHSYKVPEILAIPVLKGNPAYLQWLDAVLEGGRQKRETRSQ